MTAGPTHMQLAAAAHRHDGTKRKARFGRQALSGGTIHMINRLPLYSLVPLSLALDWHALSSLSATDQLSTHLIGLLEYTC